MLPFPKFLTAKLSRFINTETADARRCTPMDPRTSACIGGFIPVAPNMARILNAIDPEAVRLAAEIIRQGGLVAFPTETVYGLGADASNSMAAARVFEVKQRPSFDPLIVHVASVEDAHHYGRLEEERAQALMNRFWPGPMTLVVPKRE